MDNKYKIVFVDKILPISQYEKEIIEGFGCSVQQYDAIMPEDILKVAKDADAIMTVGGKFTKEVIEGLDKCKVIGRYGVGVDNIDLEAATKKGIVVTYVPIYCQEEVAALAVSLLLACDRKILKADKAVKSGKWADRHRGEKSEGESFRTYRLWRHCPGSGSADEAFWCEYYSV